MAGHILLFAKGSCSIRPPSRARAHAHERTRTGKSEGYEYYSHPLRPRAPRMGKSALRSGPPWPEGLFSAPGAPVAWWTHRHKGKGQRMQPRACWGPLEACPAHGLACRPSSAPRVSLVVTPFARLCRPHHGQGLQTPPCWPALGGRAGIGGRACLRLLQALGASGGVLAMASGSACSACVACRQGGALLSAHGGASPRKEGSADEEAETLLAGRAG